jgi:hypothetical protein
MLRKDLPSFSEPFFTHLARSLKGVAMCLKNEEFFDDYRTGKMLQKISYIKINQMKKDEI